MSSLQMLLIIIYIIVSLILILVILLQPAKSSGCGTSGLDGTSVHSTFGARGPAPLLMKLTYFLMISIMIFALMLGRSIILHNRYSMWYNIIKKTDTKQ